MGSVTGNNFRLYSGDGLKPIGCEDSCILTTTTEEIITTSKESGVWTNREAGRNDWRIQVSAMVFINAAFDGSGTNLDPFEFLAYQMQGKKVVAKLQLTDGTNTKYVIGKGVVLQSEYAGQAGEFLLANVTIAADGPLHAVSSLKSRTEYGGPSTYIYESTTTTDTITDVVLENANQIYYVIKKTATDDVGILMRQSIIFSPFFDNEFIYTASTGTFDFEDDLVDGDTIIIVYDPA